ncbi:MAG: hypothetical protein ACTHOD_10335 [Motilibacteraceae bacterium]
MHARKPIAALAGVVALGLSTLTAAGTAAAAGPAGCSGGELGSGTYGTVIVTSECSVPDGATVTVLHNLIVSPGAVFDAQAHAVIRIEGNVVAQPGSMVALGCTDAHPCTSDVEGEVYDRTGDSYRVDRNIVLNQVFDAAINGVHVGGNVVSSGGGPGYRMDPWIPFSIKDDSIGGNLVVTGLRTTWFGVIRTTVGGNVVLQDIEAADPDGNEVVSNTIGRNLVCHGMTPAPQLGDAVEGAPAGYGPNSIGGRALGQCASIR